MDQDPGADAAAAANHGSLAAAQRQADPRPAVPAAPRLHRHCCRHRRVLRRLQGGSGE